MSKIRNVVLAAGIGLGSSLMSTEIAGAEQTLPDPAPLAQNLGLLALEKGLPEVPGNLAAQENNDIVVRLPRTETFAILGAAIMMSGSILYRKARYYEKGY